MIRVRVPLDLHAVATDGCSAFALATPLRARELLEMAVREVVGVRAPADKFARSLNRTLHGLEQGIFRMVVDGREIHEMDGVVLCSNIADVRFFLNAWSKPVRSAR